MGFLVLRSSQSAGAGDEPAFGARAIGVSESTQNAADTTIILDLRQDFTDSNLLWITTEPVSGTTERLPSYTHQPTGGYWGTGGCKIVPGHFTDPGDPQGQHACGFGEMHNFDTIAGGACRQIAVGQLSRWGSTYYSQQSGYKDLILLRDGDTGGGGRPMIIPKVNAFTGDMIFPACDDEMCNCSRDPADDEFGNDEPNPWFNYEDYFGEWVWLELRVDMDAGWIRTYIWTADGVHNGTFMTEQDFASSGTAGSIPGLDKFNFLNSVDSPDANCYKEMCWIEFRLGSSAAITPPTGFPGSSR